MAAKKPSRASNKQRLKPEVVYTAKKRTVKAPAKPRKVIKKRRKPLLLRHINRHLFFVIIFIVSVAVTVLVWTYVAKQVYEANLIFSQAQQITNSSALKKLSQLNIARAVGSDQKLKTEIVNLQSASYDLQQYVLTDYRLFKQKCVANGQLVSASSYKITSVVYDNFATIERACNGTDKIIVKKFDTRWAVIFSGDMYPPCSLTNDLTIPQGISFHCIQDGVSYINPNP